MTRDALRQVLLNLTLNAIDATPAGAGIALEARPRSDAEGRWVEIVVDDGGGGIAPENRTRVFEAFFSSREQGPGGLGLAISKRLVESAGGTIEVAESPSGGARFRLRVPALAVRQED
jgi:signal transduction histidine kinase